MLVFKDEDLKRLREYLTSYDPRTGRKFSVDMKLDALLARLEAAEKVIDCHQLLEREMVNYDQFVTNLNAWRKAAGK